MFKTEFGRQCLCQTKAVERLGNVKCCSKDEMCHCVCLRAPCLLTLQILNRFHLASLSALERFETLRRTIVPELPTYQLL
ncbi:hypothetical protein B5X24_HaOG201425 [Helicoverpa armigera]|nr:hypothetical protein B5X24_HaOG201425 [Helicoverpa armigera]